ncbi:hypothetical protein CYMTET_37127 [Cymbomonas tetramitiformis]|uniref:Protein kinase domain-containing protein n=1 Tax=Cymbomonas tetramitiformis TaxID=36881 RepID=A0AAE0F6R6_9CHLO|nr:hypothetical protein CYMTET_37127 [Cymbomonas tetramitiformis]
MASSPPVRASGSNRAARLLAAAERSNGGNGGDPPVVGQAAQAGAAAALDLNMDVNEEPAGEEGGAPEEPAEPTLTSENSRHPRTTAWRYGPDIVRTLAQNCNLGEVSYNMVTFSNPLGPAKKCDGGFASTRVGCTLNGTVPLVYKEFSLKHWPSASTRFSEFARELYMTTLASNSAPQYVSPILHFGLRQLGERERPACAPFLLSMDHGISLDAFLAQPPVAVTMTFKRDLCTRILTGFAALHAAGISHGDVRATNMVLSPTRPDSLVIIDFGLSRRQHKEGLPEDHYRRHRWTSGTPADAHQKPGSVYAPEYSHGGPTSATDMWAIAPILVRILIRDSEDALRRVNDDATKATVHDILGKRSSTNCVSRAIWNPVMDCAHREPGKRPTAASLARLFVASEAATDGNQVGLERWSLLKIWTLEQRRLAGGLWPESSADSFALHAQSLLLDVFGDQHLHHALFVKAGDCPLTPSANFFEFAGWPRSGCLACHRTSDWPMLIVQDQAASWNQEAVPMPASTLTGLPHEPLRSACANAYDTLDSWVDMTEFLRYRCRAFCYVRRMRQNVEGAESYSFEFTFHGHCLYGPDASWGSLLEGARPQGNAEMFLLDVPETAQRQWEPESDACAMFGSLKCPELRYDPRPFSSRALFLALVVTAVRTMFHRVVQWRVESLQSGNVVVEGQLRRGWWRKSWVTNDRPGETLMAFVYVQDKYSATGDPARGDIMVEAWCPENPIEPLMKCTGYNVSQFAPECIFRQMRTTQKIPKYGRPDYANRVIPELRDLMSAVGQSEL